MAAVEITGVGGSVVGRTQILIQGSTIDAISQKGNQYLECTRYTPTWKCGFEERHR